MLSAVAKANATQAQDLADDQGACTLREWEVIPSDAADEDEYVVV